jgi:hypothetical protein
MGRKLSKAVEIIVIGLLAGGGTALAWQLGRRPNPEVEAALHAPGAAERLTERRRLGAEEAEKDRKSPLVVEAERLALYLDPPEPPKRTPPPARPRMVRTVAHVAPVSLEGTGHGTFSVLFVFRLSRPAVGPTLGGNKT